VKNAFDVEQLKMFSLTTTTHQPKRQQLQTLRQVLAKCVYLMKFLSVNCFVSLAIQKKGKKLVMSEKQHTGLAECTNTTNVGAIYALPQIDYGGKFTVNANRAKNAG
jgi:hypothetical protein